MRITYVMKLGNIAIFHLCIQPAHDCLVSALVKRWKFWYTIVLKQDGYVICLEALPLKSGDIGPQSVSTIHWLSMVCID